MIDRRVVRTRAALTQALFELITERRWERITVQDLLDRADVSRSTFYAHFDNKLDVLTSGIPDVVAMIVVDPATGGLDVRSVFQHADEMAAVLAPLLSQPILGEIAEALERGLAAGFARVIDERSAPHLPGFLAGAMVSSLRTLVTLRRRPPVEEIAIEIERYVLRLTEGHLRPIV